MYWNQDSECISHERLEELKLKRLKQTVERASSSPFYKKHNLKDHIITTLSDIRKLPFTTKQDLRDAYPFGMVCIALDDVVRLHSSSGTTGTPTVVYHSMSDINRWTELVARCLTMIGVRKHDVFQNMIGYGLFTGGLGLHYGAERIGCLTIPTGPGNTKRQFKFMKDFGWKRYGRTAWISRRSRSSILAWSRLIFFPARLSVNQARPIDVIYRAGSTPASRGTSKLFRWRRSSRCCRRTHSVSARF